MFAASRNPLGLLLTLAAVTAAPSLAAELKVRAWPLSDHPYDAIDAGSVRVEPYIPETAWLAQVGSANGALSLEISLLPVASIDVSRLYDEQDIDEAAPLLEEARKAASRVGANVVFLEKTLLEGKELGGMRFIAYRAEYKHRLISPTYLAALPHLAISATFLEEQLQAWASAQFGNTRLPFDSLDGTATHQAIDILSGVKNGTSVRVFMRDGSNLQGAFSGMDEDNRIWIHPRGLAGLFRDRAVSAWDVQSVAFLN
jgi:hypothetical protein